MQTRKTSIAIGLLLILLGMWFLIAQFVPGLSYWLIPTTSWPLAIVGVGIVFLVFAVVARAPGLAIPGCIIGGIGLLLYWQNLTNNWQSWAYAWTLIPGFVGLGILISAVFGDRRRNTLASGGWLILVSVILFLVFSSFLGGPGLGPYWPVLLIGLGVLLLVRSFYRWRS